MAQVVTRKISKKLKNYFQKKKKKKKRFDSNSNYASQWFDLNPLILGWVGEWVGFWVGFRT